MFNLTDIVFWIFCLITIGGALYVLTSRNVLYSAYGLLVSFLGVAGIFIFGDAEFVSAAQIMIYAGGIIVVLLFAIMLGSNRKSGVGFLQIKESHPLLSIGFASVLSILLLFLVARLLIISGGERMDKPVKTLGEQLMTSHVFILELIGILLLMALIGATYIAKDDK